MPRARGFQNALSFRRSVNDRANLLDQHHKLSPGVASGVRQPALADQDLKSFVLKKKSVIDLVNVSDNTP